MFKWWLCKGSCGGDYGDCVKGRVTVPNNFLLGVCSLEIVPWYVCKFGCKFGVIPWSYKPPPPFNPSLP